MKADTLKENPGAGKRALPWCAAACAVTALCAAIAMALNSIHPFGGRSILLGDLNCEYLPFLTELWDKFHSGDSLAYSWRTALGGNFIGNYLYYLASPLNLAVLLVDRSQILNVIEALIFIRQAFAAFAMTLFLSRHKGCRAGMSAAVCGVCYAFCGWFAAYFTNIIWLDAFALLPLLAYGIERIVDRYSPWLFAACFLWILFSNFYTAFIIGVATVVYWLWYVCGIAETGGGNGKKGKKETVPFVRSRLFRSGGVLAVTTLLCGLALGVVLVPLVLLIRQNSENESMVSFAGIFHQFSAKIANSLSGSLALADMRTANNPHVYAGILALAAVPLYFFAKHIPARGKIASAAVILFFWLSYNISALDFLWHGFRYPNGFPFRQTFAYSFFLLLLAGKAVSGISEIPKKAFAVSAGLFGIVLLAGAVGRAKYGGEAGITPQALGVSAALFALFCLVLLVLRGHPRKTVALLCAAALLLLTGADGAWNLSENLRFYQSDSAENARNYASMRELTEQTAALPFHREELTIASVVNDGAYYGYNGVRQSSSLISSNTLRFLNRMGMDSNLSNIAEIYPQTPVLNSIFGIRYLYEAKQWAEFSHISLLNHEQEQLRLLDSSELFNRYEFGCALPLGFAADEALTEWTPAELSAMDNQNGFYAAASGRSAPVLSDCEASGFVVPVEEAEVLETAPGRYDFSLPANYTDDTLPVMECEFTAPRDGTMYIYVDMSCEKVPNVICNLKKPEGDAYTARSAGTTYMSRAYDAKKGGILKFTLLSKPGATGTFTVRAFMVDADELQKQYEAIMAGGALEVETFSDTLVTGAATINEDGKILCTSIPYDEGWTATVDGRELADDEIYRVGGCLMGFDLPKGTHTVAFRYTLPGLRTGIILSVSSVIIAALAIFFRKRLSGEKT